MSRLRHPTEDSPWAKALILAMVAAFLASVLVLPMVSEITPLMIITKLEQYDYTGATAIATVMLILSFTLLLVINGLQAWTASVPKPRTGRDR